MCALSLLPLILSEPCLLLHFQVPALLKPSGYSMRPPILWFLVPNLPISSTLAVGSSFLRPMLQRSLPSIVMIACLFYCHGSWPSLPPHPM